MSFTKSLYMKEEIQKNNKENLIDSEPIKKNYDTMLLTNRQNSKNRMIAKAFLNLRPISIHFLLNDIHPFMSSLLPRLTVTMCCY